MNHTPKSRENLPPWVRLFVFFGPFRPISKVNYLLLNSFSEIICFFVVQDPFGPISKVNGLLSILLFVNLSVFLKENHHSFSFEV